MGLFENQVPVDSITIMVQKEVADRMQVGPGTKDYGGAFTGCAILCETKDRGKCTAQLFYAKT